MAESAMRTEEAANPPPRDNVHVLPARYVGHVDAIEGGFVRGWARDEAMPGARTEIDVFLGERPLGSTIADRYRDDLMTAGMGDGRHAFVFALPDEARDAPAAAIGVFFRGTRIPLIRSDGTAGRRTADPGLGELVEMTQAVRSGMERLASRVATLARDQTRLNEQASAFAREIEQHGATLEADRRKSTEAAALAVREETHGLTRRVEAIEKSFADVDAFLVRIDSSLRKLATKPEPRRHDGAIILALAIFAVLASALAILAALAPGSFQSLLRPLLG